MWFRVFSPMAAAVAPAALVERLHAVGCLVVPHFRGDDLGWTAGELVLPGGGSPLVLNRYLTDIDDLRADLNAFAAELETMDYSPNSGPLMERVIQTQQMVTFRRPIDHANESALDLACDTMAKYLSQELQGMYQIDGQGWFEMNGTLLVQEY